MTDEFDQVCPFMRWLPQHKLIVKVENFSNVELVRTWPKSIFFSKGLTWGWVQKSVQTIQWWERHLQRSSIRGLDAQELKMQGVVKRKGNPEKSQIPYVMMTIHDNAPFIPGWYKCLPVHPSWNRAIPSGGNPKILCFSLLKKWAYFQGSIWWATVVENMYVKFFIFLHRF